jgi:hypothetical protein
LFHGVRRIADHVALLLDPAWRRWDGGKVRSLAEQIHAARDLDALPVLADALEDAGCAAADLLGHLRRPGGHVPGCWALDLLRGAS